MSESHTKIVSSLSLDYKKLIETAIDVSGLTDFGDTGFIKSFEKHIECLNIDAGFHFVGFEQFKDEAINDLVNRLRFEKDLKLHSEILKEDVSDPIIIIGLPRSGTTKTQRMIGADPNLLNTYMWQLRNPAPFPDAVEGQIDPRIAAVQESDALAEGSPEVHAAHHMAANQVEEDWELFRLTFNDWFGNMRNYSESWTSWLLSRSQPSDRENYHYVRSLFQYLQWQQGGRQGRRRLMKSCSHLAFLKELLEVYPNATLVHIHRDPMSCIPSWSKLMLDIWNLRCANMDSHFIGKSILDWSSDALNKYMKTRDELGLNDKIIDVQYEQIRQNPLPVIEEIYQAANLPFTDEAKQNMEVWEQENEQGKHGKHNYSLEQFGLSAEKINLALGEYSERFIK